MDILPEYISTVYISSLNLHYFLCKTLTDYSTDSYYFNHTLISGIMVYTIYPMLQYQRLKSI